MKQKVYNFLATAFFSLFTISIIFFEIIFMASFLYFSLMTIQWLFS